MATDDLNPVTDGTLTSDESLNVALSVSTDQSDYAPGSTATITASNVAAGGTVTFEVDQTIAGVVVTNSTITGTGIAWTAVDGGAGDLDGLVNGTVVTNWSVGQDAANQSFVVSANDGINTVTASFTDSAAALDLTATGSSGALGGAVFVQSTIGAGTGKFPSFVRIQNSPTEQGYNYDLAGGVTPQFDEKTDAPHEHKLLLASVPTIVGDGTNGTTAGVTYRVFYLDVNESGGSSAPISLDALQIYQETSGSLGGTFTSHSGFGAPNEHLVYDLGANNWIALQDLESGSGKSDYTVLIPESNFNSNPYVYLYSQFGVQGASWITDGGFEEWAVGPAVAGPAINIDKVTTDTTVGHEAGPDDGIVVTAGDAITWTYTVTNIGNTDLSNIQVTDNRGVTVTPDLVGGFNIGDANTDGILNVGEQWTYTATGIAGANNYSNIGTVTGDYTSSKHTIQTVTDSDPSNYIVHSGGNDHASLLLDKTTQDMADPSGTPGDGMTILTGEPVQWIYDVTNNGNVALTNITITDDQGVAATFDSFVTGNADNVLDPGETWRFIGTGTAITGQYSNSAYATGTLADSSTVDSDPETSNYTGVNAHLTLDKVTADVADGNVDGTPGDGNTILTGENIQWQYTVTNDGNVDLTNIVVVDDNGTPLDTSDDVTVGTIALLAAGASTTLTLDGVAGKGLYTNVGTATADTITDSAGHETTPSDTNASNYTGVYAHLTLDKVTADLGKDDIVDGTPGDGNTILAGESIQWQYTVTNDGNVGLTNIVVVDDNGTPGDTSDDVTVGTIASLAAGASTTLTLNGVAGTGLYTNVATATADTITDSAGHDTMPSDTDPSSYFGAAPGLTIDKSITGHTGSGVGEVISYEIDVTNTGNVAFGSIVVKDTLEGHATDTLDNTTVVETGGDPLLNNNGILDVGETWKYTFTYTITQTDIDNNSKLVWQDGGAPAGYDNLSKNGALFFSGTDTPATGSGLIDSFVRIHAKGTEQGYNTDAAPVMDTDSTHIFDHSIKLSEIPITWVNGVAYREFRVDLNESNNSNSQQITLAALKIYSGDGGAFTNLDLTKTVDAFTGGGSKLLYDLGGAVQLYDWSTGSGHGDYSVLIPDAAFSTAGSIDGNTVADPYIYLYSQFGNADDPNATGVTNGGFEEWYVKRNDFDFNNTASVTGTFTDTAGHKDTETGSDSASIPVTYTANMSVHKDATVTPVGGGGGDGKVHNVGDTIHYTITVANLGNVDLTGIVTTDSFEGGAPVVKTGAVQTGGAGDHNDAVIEVGETWTYSYDYVVQQTDLDYAGKNTASPGNIDNTAIVDSNETHPQSSTKLVDPPVSVVPNSATLTTGADTVTFSAGTNTINATAATLNAGDKLTGGSGTDTLALTGTGSINLNTPAVFSSIEKVTLGSSGEIVTLRNGTNLTVSGGAGNTVTLGTGNANVSFTSGTNTVNATAATLNAGDSLIGGSGADKLALTGAGTFNLALLGAFSGFETITLAASETLALNVGGGALTVTGTSGGTDSLDLSNGTSGATVTTSNVSGGGFGSTNYTNIGSYTATGYGDTITASSAANTIHGGGGNDIITGGGGADNVYGDAGNDTLVFASKTNLDAALVIDGGAGTDTLKMSAAATLVDSDFAKVAPGSMEVLQLTGASTVTLGAAAKAAGITTVIAGAGNTTINDTLGALTSIDASALSTSQTLTLTGGNAAQSLSINLNANLTASADAANLTVVGGAAANKLITGSGADRITGGGGADVVTGGAGADTFIYKLASDSLVATKDTIADFAHGTDHIDLSAFALVNQTIKIAPVGSFQTSASTNFFGSYGIVDQTSGGHSQIYVDVNGNHNFDPTVDLVINSTAQFTAGSSDFFF